MNRYLVVATKEELELPAALNTGRTIIVTGVGGTNVLKGLAFLPRDADILNVGFCGSTYFPIGSVVEVSDVMLYHPNCTFDEPHFRISGGNATCLTSGDFVSGGKMPDGSVVDMELAYICGMGFRDVRSIKYVSDNLCYGEYQKSVGMQK